ncbi:MAG TPA: phosphotransferase [Acidobacteriota bacterium]|nr:phosphotransferase [Acidobacteriota bacterium]
MTDSINQRVVGKISAVFGAGTVVSELTALAGDASSRRYYRARLSGANVPQTMIVMELPVGSALPLSSEELAIFKEGPKELPFLNLHRFLSAIGVKVPKLYGQWESDGLLFLEDLGDTSLWDQVQNLPENEVLAWYRKAIDELLNLQLRGTKARDDRCLAFQQRFDAKLYMWEFEHFIEWGLAKRPGAIVGAASIAALRKIFAEIAAILDRQTPYLNHRDYHSWNLMVHEDTVRVIDFQDALLAPPQYDLASLLNDRITDSVILPPMEAQLVRYFFERKRDLEKDSTSFDEFTEIYHLSAIQRDLKVVGRFYYLDIVKGKPGYMKFVPPTARRLKRNLAQTAQTKIILPLLIEHLEAML